MTRLRKGWRGLGGGPRPAKKPQKNPGHPACALLAAWLYPGLTSLRGHSSVGRALEWHSRGRRFDSDWLHQFDRLSGNGQPVFICGPRQAGPRHPAETAACAAAHPPLYARLTSLRGHSSVGRALEWHSRGRRFDSDWLHQ